MEDKQKRIIVILMVLTIIFTISGGTLAYWTWTTNEEQKTEVTFTFEQDFSCAADGGGSITSGDAFIAPTSCTNTQHAIQREVTVTPTILRDGLTINMDLWLDINSIGSGLTSSNNFRYALTTSSTSCTDGVVAKGSFNGKSAGNSVPLLNRQEYSGSTPQTYYLYIWLDGAETSSSTMNQSFNLSLGGSCTDIPVTQPEAPVLDEGMIPVTIANDGTVTTVSETDPSWYDYSNKEWANVVLVSETNRSTYLNSLDDNVEVTQSDILAYYVWIPRYKYKIWTTGVSAMGNEQTIDIVFEKATDAMSTGTTVGAYRTHPAFWWDDNSDGTVDAGETVEGIWIGKFEPSAASSSTCYATATIDNCNNIDQSPRILPNVYSLDHQYIGNQFATSLKFAGGTQSGSAVAFEGNSVYGLTANTDSHMMKNSEWGAVAYLSHSVYGINEEVRKNNNSNYMTGCGALTANSSSSSTCEIVYGGATSYPQSTTGNITGVFDMSGGAREYVMGNYNNTASSAYTYFPTLPESKYYDVYLASQFTGSTNSNVNYCTIETCGGHALNETATWYNDRIFFANSTYPWFNRGNGGLFYSYVVYRGSEFDGYSWRSVLIVSY